MSEIILHIINKEKFTTGYINFMKLQMPEWNHVFYVIGDNSANISPCDLESVFLVSSSRILRNDPLFKKHMNTANKIIVSGVFNRGVIFALPARHLKKTFFQFWGGDFYQYRQPPEGIVEHLKRTMCFNAFRNCAGLIFLIDGEYEVFQEITGIQNKRFVAPMPSNPIGRIDLYEYSSVAREVDSPTIRVIVGNSATPENYHADVFCALERFKDYDIEIMCPLSYGDPDYRDEVIVMGKKIFGDKFKPILNFMSYPKYVDLLWECSVGCYFNDRQQGMGNIYSMLGLGKKVYLREKTTMWDLFSKNYTVFSIDDLKKISWEDLDFLGRLERNHNREHYREERSLESQAAQWRDILSSI